MKKIFSKLFQKKNLLPALIVLFSAVFLVSCGFLADYIIESVQQKKQYDKLSQMVEQVQQNQQDSNNNSNGSSDYVGEYGPEITPGQNRQEYTSVFDPKTGKTLTLLTDYAGVYELNSDVVGWIRINDTKINYPVLQTPEWVNYYLKRDFNGQYSKHGAIYANESADVFLPSDNVTIYGHRMKDGSMFAALHDYKDKAFYDEHPYINFDTIYERHTYKIISVFITTATVESGFAYHEFVEGDPFTFPAYVEKCKELSLYDTGETAVYGDKLITLSTCEHDIEEGRLVVVAKQIT
ncbi:MAG: class B sortase [Ruminococcaceae bacterium]|nr:class B sortase [Oscillospiraceae bacterium]